MQSKLNPDLKIRPSKTLKGYHILLDPLAECVEDEALDSLDRARVACHGWQNHLWLTENIYKPYTNPPERIGQRVRPYRREDTAKLLESEFSIRAQVLEPTFFFVTEEPWKDENESFLWWGDEICSDPEEDEISRIRYIFTPNGELRRETVYESGKVVEEEEV